MIWHGASCLNEMRSDQILGPDMADAAIDHREFAVIAQIESGRILAKESDAQKRDHLDAGRGQRPAPSGQPGA